MPIPSASNMHARSLLRDDVYRSLRDAIVDGTFEPGERLRDQELEAWLGVSRTPIREALLRLAQAGLVVAQPGRATTVAPVDPKNIGNAQSIAAAMHELAARSAVPALTDSDLTTMAAANDRLATALEVLDVDAAMNSDDEFHDVLVRASGNAMIAEVLEQVTPLIRRAERQRFASMAGRDSVRQHRAIIERCAVADAEGAAELSRVNWMTLKPELTAREE
ncbi:MULTISPECIES: GntR family transcriptional regulator [unclassified Microbacterium]|uniref:GntR family transcriptional regulator n=1 Tax=unclassified Microbacterium TaxID=2609290 RepID=UPI00214C9D3C|nr:MULTISPECIES: GntR family transcriptional regulator [unclassified Microbacterium]MCR2808715.1 GntR family transcriptional regulator [Microbacterium sp. zg.B185]WIM18854.1 GntR family transcriptional regulator [Microbacterium sp. zg-B185]